MSKLRGARLETEVMAARGDCNWRRVDELLAACRQKNSGMEHLVTFLYGELILEKFVEEQSGASDGMSVRAVHRSKGLQVCYCRTLRTRRS
jgi:hypothetical protein